MKAKKVMMTVLAAVSVLSMSANVMAAGSITNAVDTNKVTASTVTKKIVGDKTEIATEDVDVKLEEVEADTFETDIQKEVDILNQSDADTIVESAFETVFGVENIPQVDFYEAAELTQENMDLSEFKFLSPVMNLIIEGEPSEENIVEVTFTVNNLTDKIEPFMLHRCEAVSYTHLTLPTKA